MHEPNLQNVAKDFTVQFSGKQFRNLTETFKLLDYQSCHHHFIA